jgi:uncharacterized membrane protein (UPF0127 family)
MRKRWIVIIFILIVTILSLAMLVVNKNHYMKNIVTINDFSVTVDEPLYSSQFALGLGGRKSLAENQGMLFIYDHEQPLPFWMHGMLIPIDIIWLDKNCRVVHIEENVPPCSQEGTCPTYTPSVDAQYVLETAAGFSTRHQVIVNKTIVSSCQL